MRLSRRVCAVALTTIPPYCTGFVRCPSLAVDTRLSVCRRFDQKSAVAPRGSVQVPHEAQAAESLMMPVVAEDEPPAMKRHRKGPAPVVVLEGDFLESTPKQKAIVSAHYVATALAVKHIISNAALQASGWDMAGLPAAGLMVVAMSVVVWASVVFSDFFSGLFHWSADNYGDGSTPVFGGVIEAFQGHHTAPWTITYRAFANNVHKIAAATTPLVLAMVLLNFNPLLATFWLVFFNLQVLCQELHKMSHMTKPPSWAVAMQDAGLIVSRREHGLHHSSPFEGHYCIVTGQCNEWLDRTGFWRKLERVVYELTGSEPNCWKLDNQVRDVSLRS